MRKKAAQYLAGVVLITSTTWLTVMSWLMQRWTDTKAMLDWMRMATVDAAGMPTSSYSLVLMA